MGIRNKIGAIDIRNVRPINWAAYWAAHSSFYGRGRSVLTIPDDYGNDAKILPVIFRGNSTNYYRINNGNLLTIDDWVINFEAYIGTLAATTYFVAQSYGFKFGFVVGAPNKWQLDLSDGTNNRNITISLATLPKTDRKYSFKITHSKTGETNVYESGVLVGTSSGTFVQCGVGHNHFGSSFGIGTIPNTVYLSSASIYSDLTEITLLVKYIFTGGVNGEYDLSGNGKDLYSTTPTVDSRSFHTNGSTYLLDNGWALWQKVTVQDIYVPYGGIATAPAAGYLLVKNYEGSLTKINMAPCLIGFNETSSAVTALEIFDRSNTTRQEDISRTSAYYASTSLATKCRYHISEVYPYEVFNAWFKTDYKDTVFTSISKTGTDFSINAFRGCTEKQTGRYLTKIKTECEIDGLLTVGIDKNVKLITQAVTRAYDDYTITIDAGIFTNSLDLTTKKLNLVGSGNLGTIIFTTWTSAATASVLNIAKDCTFTNLLIDKREFNAGVARPIVNISACNPVFTNCKIGRDTYVDDYNSQKPMTIANGSVVNMIGCEIAITKVAGTEPYDLLITDTSKLYFEGTSINARVRTQGTAEAHIDTDYFWTNNTNTQGVTVEDDSKVYLKINIREKAFNQTTKLEHPAGTYIANAYRILNNGYFELSGNQITGGTGISGAGAICLFKDIVSTLGRFWCVIGGSAATAQTTFDNCQIVMDCDEDATGLHIIEETVGAQVNIINGSILTFSGHQGNWFTMGQAISSIGKFYIRNSTIVDNVNDNVPYGANYEHAVVCRQIDAEDSIITNQNWDSVGTNVCIRMVKDVGKNLQIRLKNVVLNNSEINTSPIGINNANALDVTDYYCEDNVTYNSSAYKMNVAAGDAPTIYAALVAACPD